MATIYLGRLEPWTAYGWIAAVSLAVIAVLVRWSASRKTAEKDAKRFSSSLLLTLALTLPVASLILAIVCFTILQGHPLSQYNDDATRSAHLWWGWSWFVFVVGIPATGFFSILPILSAAQAHSRSGLLTGLLVLVASAMSLVAVFQNFPST